MHLGRQGENRRRQIPFSILRSSKSCQCSFDRDLGENIQKMHLGRQEEIRCPQISFWWQAKAVSAALIEIWTALTIVIFKGSILIRNIKHIHQIIYLSSGVVVNRTPNVKYLCIEMRTRIEYLKQMFKMFKMFMNM